MRFTRITIIKERMPARQDVNDELQWFGASLGLFSLRDKDKSCFRIFIILLKALKAGRGLSSDEIAQQTALSRATVIHHLNRLMDAGIVTTQRNQYALNVENLEELVDLVEGNLQKTMEGLRSVAKDIDKRLGL
jgi:predicted transcriptional regulator